jgi:hypothetical protein
MIARYPIGDHYIAALGPDRSPDRAYTWAAAAGFRLSSHEAPEKQISGITGIPPAIVLDGERQYVFPGSVIW